MDRFKVVKVSLLLAMGIMPFSACGDDEPAPDDDGAAGSGDAGDGPGPGGAGGTAGALGGAGGTVVTPPEGGAGGEGTHRPVGQCTSPVQVPVTGLVRCAEGFSHRPEPVTCGDVNAGGGGADSDLPRAPDGIPCGVGGAPGAGGSAGEDCSGYYLGYCKEPSPAFDEGSECASGCAQDSDCARGYACVCGDQQSPSGGVCVPGNCATDADCGDGLLCTMWPDACGELWLECQTADDECLSDRDCTGEVEVCGITQPTQGDPRRVCRDGGVCGRPFLVDATARVAPVVERDEWSVKLHRLPSLVGLSPEQRAAQARHFSKLGQMEHASIAAFARFNLQLLALGAPPELVQACTAALADETAHTRLCFAIASHYAGRALGPGRLEVGGSLEAMTLLEVAKLVIAEGCVGETTAAVEALEAADAASDAALREAYSRIAADEQRHAELAFRFLRWASDQAPVQIRALIEGALVGLPDSPVARAVVAPCLRALLDAPRSAGTGAGNVGLARDDEGDRRVGADIVL